MSDRHAAEKLFNELLADYIAEVLPHVATGWSEARNTEKEILTRMNNFFCGLHFIVGTACKSFHTRGSQQAGCSTQFRTYLCSRGIDKIPLAAFRGNRFKILFYDAAGVYFLKHHMLLYLTTSHGPLNQLL